MIARGALVVIEGMDRTGKTTQSHKLVESLMAKNIRAERMSFPDRTTWTGQLISKYLSNTDCLINDQTIHLLFAANRWENFEKMTQTLLNGTTLIVDRYSYSGIAFSSAKGLDTNWCTQPEIGLPKPDLVLLLNLDNKQLVNRNGFGEERYETLDMQEKVRGIFHQFAKTDSSWKVIDASKSFEQVHSDLLQSIENSISNISTNKMSLQYFTKAFV